MRLSIFTPTHKIKHLRRLAESIKNQTMKDFEWVVVPNGEVCVDDVKSLVGDVDQLKIVPYEGETSNIGEIKRFSCHSCTGDILVEADHDDELTPNCLEQLDVAFEETEADFVYSNNAGIVREKDPYVFDEAFGWKHRPFTWKGLKTLEIVHFPPSPASFSTIWWAVNHVRAWERNFYNKIGGHDPLFSLLDDQDLLARSYINGKVYWIDDCLYVYHLHEANTFTGDQNQWIQENTLILYDKYIEALVAKWCDDNGLLKISLGEKEVKGYESYNPKKKWKFDDETIGMVKANSQLQKYDAIPLMKEIYRCLANNGWLISSTPSTDGRGAFQNPTNKSFWNVNSFMYYTQANAAKHIGSPVKFQKHCLKNHFPNDFCKENNIVHVRADLMKHHGRVPAKVEI